MFDPELKYCPQCNDEYMPHAEKCAACSILLVMGSELIAQQQVRQQRAGNVSIELTLRDDLVMIHGGPLPDIKYLQEQFASQGIPSLITSDDKSCGKGCCPSVFYLQVRRQDAQDALPIIQADYRRKTGLDQHDTCRTESVFDQDASEVECPACGHRFSPTISTCPDCGLCFS